MAPRDPRYTRTLGEKPHEGRRYVEDGKVRIEWTEGGKRRRRTIGANTEANRERADAALTEKLADQGGSMPAKTPAKVPTRTPTADATEKAPASDFLHGLTDTARDVALSLMDAADEMAAWLQDLWKESDAESDEESDSASTDDT